jgi:hypothetical protein
MNRSFLSLADRLPAAPLAAALVSSPADATPAVTLTASLVSFSQ